MQLKLLKPIDKMWQTLFWLNIYLDTESKSYDPVKAYELYNVFLNQLDSFLPDSETHRETLSWIASLEKKQRWNKLYWMEIMEAFVDEAIMV